MTRLLAVAVAIAIAPCITSCADVGDRVLGVLNGDANDGDLLQENGPLPLGVGELPERRTRLALADGLSYLRVERGMADPNDVYAVEVALLPDERAAEALRSALVARGEQAQVVVVDGHAPDDPKPGPMRYLVRAGAFAARDQAEALRMRLLTAGHADARVVHTGEDGRATTGPWIVHVLELDPAQFAGTLQTELAGAHLGALAPLADVAARSGALAALGGGDFVRDPRDGIVGDPLGIVVRDGVLLSDAIQGRTSLVLPPGPGTRAVVAPVRNTLTASAEDGARRFLDGVNRTPGLVPECGGDESDAPSEAPAHGAVCTDASELVLLTPAFGPESPEAAELEAVLDAEGIVTALRDHPGPIPPDSRVLAATGRAATWLRSHVPEGSRVTLDLAVEADGVAIMDGASVLRGGPRLVRTGRFAITARAEGFASREDAGAYYRFGVQRRPRALAGIDERGRLLLVVAEGEQPGRSLGLSLAESAQVMLSLGARDALHLDDHAAALVVGGEPVTPAGDEALTVGDALVLSGSR